MFSIVPRFCYIEPTSLSFFRNQEQIIVDIGIQEYFLYRNNIVVVSVPDSHVEAQFNYIWRLFKVNIIDDLIIYTQIYYLFIYSSDRHQNSCKMQCQTFDLNLDEIAFYSYVTLRDSPDWKVLGNVRRFLGSFVAAHLYWLNGCNCRNI